MEKTIEYGAWKFKIDILGIKDRGFRLKVERLNFFILENKPRDVRFKYEEETYEIPTRADIWKMYDDIGNFLMMKALKERTEKELLTLPKVTE